MHSRVTFVREFLFRESLSTRLFPREIPRERKREKEEKREREPFLWRGGGDLWMKIVDGTSVDARIFPREN